MKAGLLAKNADSDRDDENRTRDIASPILSDASMNSPWVKTELRKALAKESTQTSGFCSQCGSNAPPLSSASLALGRASAFAACASCVDRHPKGAHAKNASLVA
jgi:hypothetical protein